MKLVIELYHSGGGSGNNVVRIWFRWSGLTQKRAQSTGNHTERLWKKNLDQKVILEKKLEHFSEKKYLLLGFVKGVLPVLQAKEADFVDIRAIGFTVFHL